MRTLVAVLMLSAMTGRGEGVFAADRSTDEPSVHPILEPEPFGPGEESLVYSLEGLRGDDPDGVPLEGLRASFGFWGEDEFIGRAFLWGASQKDREGDDQTVTSAGVEVGVLTLPVGPFRLMPRFRLGAEYRAEPPDDGIAGLAGIGLELSVWIGRHLQLAVSRDRDFGFPSGTRDLSGLALRWAHVPGPARLKSAAHRGDRDEVRRLIQAGVPMEAGASHEALYGAANWCDRPMIEMLLDAWKGPADHMSELALRRIVRGCEPELTDLLLTWGQDPNADYYLGSTILMQAVDAGKLENAQRLLRSGAEVDRRGRYEGHVVEEECRATALMIAAGKGNREMVDDLLDSGADPGLTDAKGCTAEEAARREGHEEIAARLRARRPPDEEGEAPPVPEPGGNPPPAPDVEEGSRGSWTPSCRT